MVCWMLISTIVSRWVRCLACWFPQTWIIFWIKSISLTRRMVPGMIKIQPRFSMVSDVLFPWTWRSRSKIIGNKDVVILCIIKYSNYFFYTLNINLLIYLCELDNSCNMKFFLNNILHVMRWLEYLKMMHYIFHIIL